MILLRKLHKWLGLVVGLQLLLWTSSGCVFAWLNHHDVLAEHSVKVLSPSVLSTTMALEEPTAWLRNYPPGQLYEARLTSLLDVPVWRVELADRVELRRADDGRKLHLDEPLVRRLALAYYAGDGELEGLTFQPVSGVETRRQGSVWQARFNDAERTALYFAADDGHLLVARNSTWRVFDFFWMLHTMDYSGRDNFNNPLVITVATGALWLALSGVLLLTRSFRRQDFHFFRRGRRNERSIV